MYQIMIIEDDSTIRNALKKTLESYHYSVFAPTTFTNIVQDVIESKADLILLDIGLPIFDGYHICREVRKESQVPIIVVTSRDTEMDELMSLHLGADDFVTKPYNLQILLTRIERILLRTKGQHAMDAHLAVKEVILQLENSTLHYQNHLVELTKNELKILHILMKNPDKIISREEIIMELWQSDEFVDDNTLTVNINRLRKKLSEIGLADFIQTKRGQGYMI